MAKLGFRFSWILYSIFAVQSAFAQLHLTEKSNYDLNGYVYAFKETEKALTAEEAFKAFKQAQFTKTPTPDNEFYLPFVKNVYWLAVPIKAAANGSIDLEAGIANSGIYQVAYYLLTDPDSRVIKQFFTGKYYSFFTRAVKCRHYYFPIQLAPNQRALILFRLDKRGDGLNAPIRLLKKSYREQTEFSTYFQYAFFFGLMMFVSFFSLVSFLWNKDLIYLYHSLYVFCCCLFFLADGDLDYEWLYPNSPAWASIASSIYAIAIVFFMLLFMSDFLELKSGQPKLFKLTRICILAIATLFILIPLGYLSGNNIHFRMVIYYYGLICVASAWLLSIYCIIRRILDKHKPAYLYGFAILSVVLASIFYILQSLGITIHNFIPFNYLLLGFGLEISILSLALIYSFNYHRTKHLELSISLVNEQLNFGKQLLLSQQLEQQRIARDLHDELGGNLAAMKMTLQRFDPKEEKIKLLNYLIDTASDSARNIAHNLMPPGFENTALPDLLERHFQHLTANGKIHFHFFCSTSANHFTKQQELTIYRIILELSNNITKHSGATEATLQLIYNDTHLEIMMEDNGQGFDQLKGSQGMGLSNIATRTGYLNGIINTDTGKAGTTIIIQIPYQQENEAD